MGARDGKTAIVTAACSGIGASTARALARAGVRVAGGARRTERFHAGLVETESSVVRFRADTSKADDVDESVRPVTPDGVAEIVLCAVTRPRHVNVDQLVVKALQQSSGACAIRNA